MQTTGNLGLKKPEGTDVVNIDDLNYNADVLDVEVTKLATSSQAGRMSAADKAKLDSIQSGAEVNQNTFTHVKVGATTISADSKTDTLELVAGSGITLTPDATNDRVTIAVSGAMTPSPHASTHASGGSDPITPAMIGAETPAGAQQKVDAHASLTDGVHGATRSLVPNSIVMRDGNSRINAADPSSPSHVATKNYVDTYHLISALPNDVDGDTIPNGHFIYWIGAGTNSGYPYGFGTVELIKYSNSRCTRILYANGDLAQGVWYQHWFSGKGWTPWLKLIDEAGGTFSNDLLIDKDMPKFIIRARHTSGAVAGLQMRDASGADKWAAGYSPSSGAYIIYDYVKGSSRLLIEPNGRGLLDGSEIWTAGNNPSNKQSTFGYQRLQSGIVIQWATHSPTGPGTYSHTFPLAFSNVLAVVATPRLNDGEEGEIAISSLTNTGFKANLFYPGPTGSGRGYSWMAIGYV